MRHLALWLMPAVLFCGQGRYARLGDFDGNVEVQLNAADPWRPALRNLPLPESAWLRTGPQARVEVELDEGSAVRLGADSLCELSDYARLSTGQRITLVSLDRGVAYLTGAAAGRDALMFAVPGAQVTIRRGARVRLEARETWSQIAILEGTVRFSSPSAELDLKEGQTARIEPQHANRFYLYNEIAPLDTDRWNEERDKILAAASSGAQVPGLQYGLSDLDTGGSWIQIPELGLVWRPTVTEGWAPFRNGKWLWYDALGYTWVSADPWGWLPYHYGRWTRNDTAGWIWVPGKGSVFEPGEVYWMRGNGLAGWGPLASGEDWKPPAVPRLYLHVHSTFARFVPENREIDPAAAPPQIKEPLATAYFAAVLPSPSFPAARLEAARPVLRAGSTRIVPVLDGVTFEPASAVQAPPPPPEAPAPTEAVVNQPPPQPIVIVSQPPEPNLPSPAQTFYAAPIYTGIVIVDPPEHHHDRPHRNPPSPPPSAKPPQPPPKPVSAPPIPRGEQAPHRDPAPSPKPASPVHRDASSVSRADSSNASHRNQ
ncbi:MAG TPA: FecR family protein [Bryobacteraceae bacterium]|nr:FecR family protein [Bryobacteraceae bacterium]